MKLFTDLKNIFQNKFKDRSLKGEMKILVAFPPNIKQIAEKFGLTVEQAKNLLYAYGDTIYNPGNHKISRDLIVHETTHSMRQGKNIEAWWKKYLNDSEFRIMEELEAYTNQYKAFCEDQKDRNMRAKFLHRIATDVSGPVYGNMLSFKDAREVIIKCQ